MDGSRDDVPEVINRLNIIHKKCFSIKEVFLLKLKSQCMSVFKLHSNSVLNIINKLNPYYVHIHNFYQSPALHSIVRENLYI